MSSKFNYSILIHYSEIALKKNNRKFFEHLFINNIRSHIAGLDYSSIKLYEARVFIHDINLEDWGKFKSKVSKVMGLQNFALMINTTSKIEDLENAALHLVKDKEFTNFRVTTKRNNKSLDFTSQDVNIKIGAYIQLKTKKPVNLSSPNLTLHIEILERNSFVGINKYNGFSGLPANCQERALSLISSGIDSPVASFEMIKRGVNLDYVHFHSYPAINKQSINNVKKILEVLSKYQLKSTLYIVPLLSIQQKIMELVPDKYWVIFFRRYMIKIANDIAKKNNALALITGDSVGQVASQTLSNIRAISDVSDLPIIRPLAGMNKEDIVNKATTINTYEISIEPYQDCCAFFVPAHPETKAKIDIINKIAESINLNDIYNEVMNNIEIEKFKYRGNKN
ncbi:tRNA 4-thiouridine(8) synthase ThiI [Candidatus Marinimicrobia bacterium]|nr:tRNA 4-thiouridine(8) synthase ThiI [Candidatus Neomarinimicrobiota bacterium]